MRDCQIRELEGIRGMVSGSRGITGPGGGAIGFSRIVCDGGPVSRMGSDMEAKVLEAVLVEFEPGFCFELAVSPEVMEKFGLRRGQRVDRELMEKIIKANNEVTKELSGPSGEPLPVKR